MGQSPVCIAVRDVGSERGSCGCCKMTAYDKPWPSGRFIPPPVLLEDRDDLEPDAKGMGWLGQIEVRRGANQLSSDHGLLQRQVHRAQAKIDKVLLTPLQFRDGLPDLDPTSIPQIRQVSQVLAECPQFGISILGQFGQPGGNWASAEKCTEIARLRVKNVREALWKEGSTNPASESSVGNANSMDDRVTLTVVGPPAADAGFLTPQLPQGVTVRSNSPITLTSPPEESPREPGPRRRSSSKGENMSPGNLSSTTSKRKGSKKQINPTSSNDEGEGEAPKSKKRTRSSKRKSAVPES